MKKEKKICRWLTAECPEDKQQVTTEKDAGSDLLREGISNFFVSNQ